MIDILLDIFSDVPDTDIDVSEIPNNYACNDLSGVENGVFIGDEEDVENLAEAGVLDDSEHIDSCDIVRNIAMRDDFLESIGYDHVPEGYEVHHIIPLSEGGSDTPDNMVLLPEDVHQQITNIHRQEYDWSNFKGRS